MEVGQVGCTDGEDDGSFEQVKRREDYEIRE